MKSGYNFIIHYSYHYAFARDTLAASARFSRGRHGTQQSSRRVSRAKNKNSISSYSGTVPPHHLTMSRALKWSDPISNYFVVLVLICFMCRLKRSKTTSNYIKWKGRKRTSRTISDLLIFQRLLVSRPADFHHWKIVKWNCARLFFSMTLENANLRKKTTKSKRLRGL